MFKTLNYGKQIKLDEDKLQAEDIIYLINNKRTDCKNYKFCNNFFLQREIIFEIKHKKEIKQKKKKVLEIYWVCPLHCKYYTLYEDVESLVFLDFTEEQYKETSDFIDSLDEKQQLRFFSEMFYSKQSFEKYNGGNTVEQYCQNTITDGRTKSGRIKTIKR